MKTAILALAASTILAAPALAQSSGDAQSDTAGQAASGQHSAQQQQQQQTQASMGSCARMMREAHGGQARQASDTTLEAQLRSIDAVTRTLEKNGLKDVEVERASYFVMANAPGKECVLMLVDASTMKRGGTAMQTGGSGGDRASTQGTAGDRAAAAQGSGSGQDATRDSDAATSGAASGREGSGSDDQQQAGQDRTRTDARAMADRLAEQEESERMKRSSRSDVMAQLEKAGYSDIRVLNATFAATAELQDGHPVTLMVRSGVGERGGSGGSDSATQ